VKLLLDENLPESLLAHCARAFPGSAHVRTLKLERASDLEIWEYAKENSFVIVTKDGDFHHLSFLFGPPPFVIWLRVGNCSAKEIAKIFEAHEKDIVQFLKANESSILVISN
jgi:predicted nuclease of predicted toxin-antitoxin system